MPFLEQTAYNTVAKYQSRTCTATFNQPTKPGSLIVVECSSAGTLPSNVTLNFPSGFTQICSRGMRDVQMNIWYQQACPSITSLQVQAQDDNKSLQLRVFEYSGMAQTNALDKLLIQSAGSFEEQTSYPYTGSTGTTSQADELVLAFVTNQYAPTTQSGFSGNLVKLVENTSPQSWGGGTNEDWERSRVSIHQAISTSTGSYGLNAQLSSDRRWITCIATFKGASSGPAKFTSTTAPNAVTTGGRASLTVFGPLISRASAVVTGGAQARMDLFNYQYRLGGWNGLLIGSGTQFGVEGTEGLDGWQVRTSDDDLPRGDGALRGVDLEQSRQIVFHVNVGASQDDVERGMEILYRALVPQRDADFDLLWRHPTHPQKLMRVRPIDLVRTRSSEQRNYSRQSFALRAADPRQYSAVLHKVTVPVSPTAGTPLMTNVVNAGNSPAYPVITVTGPSSGPPVSRVTLVNASGLVSFDVQLTLLKGSVLTGDMDARITGAPRSPVQLDGQSKYGSWQLPRDPFRIDPDPSGQAGFNQLYLRTIPVGAPVTCTLTYRDTWAG